MQVGTGMGWLLVRDMRSPRGEEGRGMQARTESCGLASMLAGAALHLLRPSQACCACTRWSACLTLFPPTANHAAEVAAKKAELAARKEERRKAMAELQARKRMLGNIVFVGQLFK